MNVHFIVNAPPIVTKSSAFTIQLKQEKYSRNNCFRYICNQNKNRSKTAEELFKTEIKTKSAGLFNNEPLTEKELEWGNTVVVMEERQRKEIAKRFPSMYLKKRILSAEISDIYSTVMRIKNPNRPKERGIWLCDMNLAIGIFSVTNLTPK
jgi:predicted protein tyrosine phosphatase